MFSPAAPSCRPYSIEPLEPRTLFSTYPNVLVNNPALDTTSADTQSTTAVIAFGSTVLVAYTDSGSTNGGTSHYIGYARSIDQGQSFTDLGRLPDSTKGDGTEPSLARDNFSGAIYLASRSSASKGVQIFKSVDNGLTFTLMATVLAGGLGQQVMPNIAVDNFPGAGQGNIYVGYRTVGPPNGMTFSCSTNGGVSFTTTSVNLQGNSTGFDGAHIVVGPDHAVFYFWYNGTTGTSKISLIKSTDQGATFSPLITVATLAVIPAGVSGFIGTTESSAADLGLPFQTFAYPQAVVNPVTGDLYVVYPDKTATTGTDIFLTQSTDAGQTWSTPYRVNDDTTANDQWQPSLSIKPDGSELFVGFYDRRNDPSNTLIDTYGAIADITGPSLTWRPNFRITTTSFSPVFGVDPTVDSAISSLYMGDYDNSYADNSGFYYTWGDNRNDAVFRPGKQADVRFAHISSGFTAVSTNPDGGSIVSVPPAEFLVNFSDAYDPASVDAGDFTVNGVPADTVALTSSTSLTFHFIASPVVALGAQTMSIAGGAILRESDALAISGFSESFNYGLVPFSAAAASPGPGSTVNLPPVDFQINFSAPYDSSSVQASDLTVNGIPADSVSFTGASILTFHYNASPVTVAGTQSLAIAAGAISRLSDAIALQTLAAQFNYVIVPLTVASTQPAAGAFISAAPLDYTVTLNQNDDPSSVQASDFTVNGIPATSFTLTSSTSITFHFSNTPAPNPGAETMAIPAGAILAQGTEAPIAAFSAIFTVTAPASPPSAPVLLASCDSGISNSDNITNFNNAFSAKALQFSVSNTISGATVGIYLNGILYGSAIATSSTTIVTLIANTQISDGVQNFTARQTPTNAAQSPDSPSLALSIDTVAPHAPTSLYLPPDSDTGYWNNDGVTFDNTPTYEIFGSTPYTRVFANGTLYGPAYFSGSSFTFPVLPDAVYTITAAAVDVAGNVSATIPAQTHLTIDTVAPTNDAAPQLDPGHDTGVSNSDGITNRNALWINGVGGPYIQVYVNGQPAAGLSYGTATLDPLPDGTYSITATSADLAGNQSPMSAPITVTIDTVAPQAPPAPVLQNGNGNTVNTPTPTFSISAAEPGALQLVTDGMVSGRSPLFVPVAGNISYTDPGYGQNFLSPHLTTGGGSLFPADLNLDGKSDLVVGHFSDFLIYLSNGDGTFTLTQTISVGSNFGGLAIGDFNGDTVPDLAVTNGNGHEVFIYAGSGNGQFHLVYVRNTLFSTGYTVAADFNHDGVLDLLSSGDQAVEISLGTGVGSFLGPVAVNTDSASAGQIVTGDFNNDGKLDFVVSEGDAQSLTVYLGNGDGTFQPRVRYALVGIPGRIAVADFNHDGYLDLSTTDGNFLSVLINNGNGTFKPAMNIPGFVYANGIAAADFDHDGNIDLATANEEGDNFAVLYGNGDGTFRSPPVTYPAADEPLDSTTADFNGDGWADMIVFGDQNNGFTVSLNRPATPLAPGNHTVTAYAEDLAGNISSASPPLSFTIDTAAPTIAILPVAPSIRDTGISSLPITFSMPVFGLSLAQISLIRGSSSVDLSGAALTTTDNIHWTLAGLSDLTAPAGIYTITVTPDSTTDLAGDAVANTASVSFSVLTITLTPGQDISLRTAASTMPGMTDIFINNTTSTPDYTWSLSGSAPLLNISGGGITSGFPGSLAPTANTNINILGGQFAINSDLGATANKVNINVFSSSAITFSTTQHLASLNIAGGSVSLAPATNQILIVGSLLFSSDGSLDVADNSVIVQGTPSAYIRGALATGFNTGDWTGPGIQSTTAHANPLHAIGYAQASELGISSYMGNVVDPTDTILRYTKYGDNNLDGTVDIGNDFSLFLDGLVNKNASSWVQGDYTFDGKVDLGNDANLFLRSYLTPAVSTPAAQIAAAPALKVNPITSPFTLDNSQSPLDWTLNEI